MRSHNKAIGKSGTGLVLILVWSVMASSAAAVNCAAAQKERHEKARQLA